MIATGAPSLYQAAAALGASLVIAGAARAVRALSRSGMAAATVVGTLVFGCGGWHGAAALLLFFATSTALGRLGRKKKAAMAFEKGGERDSAQVLANGGFAALACIFLSFPAAKAIAVALILGALAEANADTWATEIGSLAAGAPRLITTLRPALAGQSGAVSFRGTAAAFAGAALIGCVASFGWGGPRIALAATVGGFCGALFDSLLGATLQAQFRCAICGRLAEQRYHCGAPTTLARGYPWLGNDAVNALSTVFGAALAAVLSLLFR